MIVIIVILLALVLVSHSTATRHRTESAHRGRELSRVFSALRIEKDKTTQMAWEISKLRSESKLKE